MTKAIFKWLAAIITLIIVVTGIGISLVFEHFMLNYTQQNMYNMLLLTDNSLDYSAPLQAQVEKLVLRIFDENTRLTITDTAGNVLADSNFSNLENHADREEILELDPAVSGYTSAIRYSETRKHKCLYVACYSPDNNNYILRLSMLYDNLLQQTKSILFIILGCLISILIVAFFLASIISKKLTKPISEISEDLNSGQSLGTSKYQEVNSIISAIDNLSAKESKAKHRLAREKSKNLLILENLNEGLIIVNSRSEVVNINTAALDILGVKNSSTGESLVRYCKSPQVLEGVERVLKGENTIPFDLAIEETDSIYEVHISGITSGIISGSESGAIILFVNVTSDRHTQRLRQEFFSDAGHQLKTPITSIQGYAELLTGNLEYTEEQRTDFLRRIHREAQNMTSLINDILTVSRLESGTNYSNPAEINIKMLISDILTSFEPAIRQNNLSVTLNCSSDVIVADYTHINQLLGNLISNAVKYNCENGTIDIETCLHNDIFYFAITDSGIGIPQAQQSLVFRRFYRADKTHGKKISGTGLGLAIVKHIVSAYKGNITLNSIPQKGTQIIVELPLDRLKD